MGQTQKIKSGGQGFLWQRRGGKKGGKKSRHHKKREKSQKRRVSARKTRYDNKRGKSGRVGGGDCQVNGMVGGLYPGFPRSLR